MEVRHFVLSEYFGVEDDGKYTFAGIFDNILSTTFPTRLGMGILTVVLNTVVGEDTSKATLRVELRAEGNPEPLSATDAPIPSTENGDPPGTFVSAFVRVRAHPAEIPAPGVYYFDARLNGEVVRTVRLSAQVVESVEGIL